MAVKANPADAPIHPEVAAQQGGADELPGRRPRQNVDRKRTVFGDLEAGQPAPRSGPQLRLRTLMPRAQRRPARPRPRPTRRRAGRRPRPRRPRDGRSSTASTSAGATFSPPVTIVSALRPVTVQPAGRVERAEVPGAQRPPRAGDRRARDEDLAVVRRGRRACRTAAGRVGGRRPDAAWSPASRPPSARRSARPDAAAWARARQRGRYRAAADERPAQRGGVCRPASSRRRERRRHQRDQRDAVVRSATRARARCPSPRARPPSCRRSRCARGSLSPPTWLSGSAESQRSSGCDAERARRCPARSTAGCRTSARPAWARRWCPDVCSDAGGRGEVVRAIGAQRARSHARSAPRRTCRRRAARTRSGAGRAGRRSPPRSQIACSATAKSVARRQGDRHA